MKALLRTSATGLTVFVLLTGFVRGQDLAEITAATRELRQTIRDLDQRISRLEKLLDREARQAKDKTKDKNQKKNPREASVPPREVPVQIDPAAQLIAGQDSYRRGLLEEKAEQWEKAIALYTEAVRFDTGNSLAFLHRAMSNLHAGRLDQALADANQSLSIQPNSAQAYAFRGSVHLAEKAHDQALSDFTEASLRDPENPDYIVRQAEAEQARGRLKAAVQLYDAAAKLRPNSGEILMKTAGVLRQTNQPGRAVELCSKVITLTPDSAEGYACRAESLLRMGLLPNAISDLNRAFSLQPSLPEVAKLLPVVKDMIQVNESFAALTAAQSVIQPTVVVENPQPTCAPAPTVKAAAPEPAAPAAVKPTASEHPPAGKPVSTKSRDPLREGRKSIEEGKFEQAVAVLGQAIELDPASAVAYNSRGYAYLRTRHYDLAIRDFSTAIKINSGYANAYWNRSAARRLSGDVPGSREDIQLATRLGHPVNLAAR